MNTRRSFLQSLAAGIAALGLPKMLPAFAPAKGVPGVSYFHAIHCGTPEGYGLFIDGEDCGWWVVEADLLQGWVKGYAHVIDAEGKRFLVVAGTNDVPVVMRGKVELRRAAKDETPVVSKYIGPEWEQRPPRTDMAEAVKQTNDLLCQLNDEIKKLGRTS